MEKKKNKELIFFGKPSIIVEKLKEKYGLGKEKSDNLSDIPGHQIAIVAKEIAIGKINKKDLISTLKKRLNIKKDVAEKLAKDIEKKLLVLAKWVPIKKEDLPKSRASKLTKGKIIEIKKNKPPTIKDKYLEKIE